MNRVKKFVVAAVAASITLGAVLAQPVAANASTPVEHSVRVPAGPCNVAPQMIFKTGQSGRLYWYTLQNCYSNSVRVQVAAAVAGGGWGKCTTVAASKTLSYSGSVNPFTTWRYC